MKKGLIALWLLLGLTAHAQKEKATAYINAYKDLAMAEMIRVGIPASITLAQGILESQSGESNLAKVSNNHFGIKCKTEWTGPKTYHDDDEKGECFRVYATVEESYKDHSEFLRTRPHYAFLFTLKTTDSEGWAKGLKKAGYATSPTYPQRLLKVINDYQLDQYNTLALQKQTPGLPETTAYNNSKTEKQVTGNNDPAPNTPGNMEEESDKSKPVAIAKDPVIEKPVITVSNQPVSYPKGIFTINHSKVVFASEGLSLLALANQYDIQLAKLLEYNELPGMDILDTDRLIFLERKMKKGAAEFHMVLPGEGLHEISQKEGLRLEYLLEYNRLTRGSAVNTGDKLFLQPVNTGAAQPVKLPK